MPPLFQKAAHFKAPGRTWEIELFRYIQCLTSCATNGAYLKWLLKFNIFSAHLQVERAFLGQNVEASSAREFDISAFFRRQRTPEVSQNGAFFRTKGLYAPRPYTDISY